MRNRKLGLDYFHATGSRDSVWSGVSWRNIAACITVSCLAVALNHAGVGASAEPPIVVEVSPSVVSLGHEFTVNVRLGSDSEPVQDILGLGFQLHYDPGALTARSVQSGEFLDDGSILLFTDVDSAAGIVACGITRTGNAGAKGFGLAAQIAFVVGPAAKADTSYPILITDVAAISPSGIPVGLLPVSGSIFVERPVSTGAWTWGRIKARLRQ